MQNNTNIYGNIDLSLTRKKRFTIDNDENRILELNTSDINIVNRASSVLPKLYEFAGTISDVPDEDSVNALNDIDTKMRECLDEIFDSNVSEICAPYGSMYDPFNGDFRFEIIFNAILQLYNDNIASEAKKLQKKIKAHTDKYTKKT